MIPTSLNSCELLTEFVILLAQFQQINLKLKISTVHTFYLQMFVRIKLTA